MVRRSLFLIGFVVVAGAVPARGEDFFEALGNAIEAAANEGGYYGDYEHEEYTHGRWPVGRPAQSQYWPQNRVEQSFQFKRVWNGNSWEYVPIGAASSTSLAPGTNVYPPANVVHPNSSVVYPSTVVSPATTVTSAAVTANTLPYKGPGVTIKLEESEGGAVTYLVDGRESATIHAGHQQTLTTKGRYEVRFSRGVAPDGRSFGEARYTLTEGNYSFKVTDKGWELLRDKQQPALASASSPSGIKTNALPPKTAPDARSLFPPAGHRFDSKTMLRFYDQYKANPGAWPPAAPATPGTGPVPAPPASPNG